MNIEPGKYYHGLAFLMAGRCPAFPQGGDIQLMVWRNETEFATWHVDYRYRYYAGTDDPWDGTDKKSFYHAQAEIGADPVEKFVEKFLEAFHASSVIAGVPLGDPDWIMIRGNSEDAMNAIHTADKDWLHVKKLSREEAIAHGYDTPVDDSK